MADCEKDDWCLAVSKLDMVCLDLNADEILTLVNLACRLRDGRRAYGPLDLRGDSRDWRKELRDELRDLLIYSAFIEIRDELTGEVNGAKADKKKATGVGNTKRAGTKRRSAGAKKGRGRS